MISIVAGTKSTSLEELAHLKVAVTSWAPQILEVDAETADELRLRQGDHFGRVGLNISVGFCERHQSKIFRTAFRILRNREDAQDAARRSFQRAFTKLSRFRGDSAFSTWLTRIAINEARSIRQIEKLEATLDAMAQSAPKVHQVN